MDYELSQMISFDKDSVNSSFSDFSQKYETVNTYKDVIEHEEDSIF